MQFCIATCHFPILKTFISFLVGLGFAKGPIQIFLTGIIRKITSQWWYNRNISYESGSSKKYNSGGRRIFHLSLHSNYKENALSLLISSIWLLGFGFGFGSGLYLCRNSFWMRPSKIVCMFHISSLVPFPAIYPKTNTKYKTTYFQLKCKYSYQYLIL